jgi:ubiquitin-protein ligase
MSKMSNMSPADKASNTSKSVITLYDEEDDNTDDDVVIIDDDVTVIVDNDVVFVDGDDDVIAIKENLGDSARSMKQIGQSICGLLQKIDVIFSTYGNQQKSSVPSKKHVVSSKKASSSGSWVRGTGFGGSVGGQNSFHTSQAHLAELALDVEVSKVMDLLRDQMRAIHREVNSTVEITAEFVGSLRAALQASGATNILSHRGLCWILDTYLRNDSLVDIGARRIVYQSVLAFVSLVAQGFVLIDLLNDPLNASSRDETCTDLSASVTCLSLVKVLQSQASLFLKLNQQLVGSGEDDDEDIVEALSMALHINQTYEDVHVNVNMADALGILAFMTVPCMSVPQKASHAKNFMNNVASKIPTASGIDPTTHEDYVDPEAGRLAKEYCASLREKCFEVVEMVEMIRTAAEHGLVNCSHEFLKLNTSSTATTKARMSRITKELSSLITNLPVELGSSIFVRCDEARQDLLKALIIGPEGTPYSNGCFEFDIMLPANYPVAPPHVRLITTGGGQVRFNPNLYNCGKVCLSLLGTWSGPSWDPQVSTLLQVLISIQRYTAVSVFV